MTVKKDTARILSLTIFAGLLVGITGTVTTTSVMAQGHEPLTTDYVLAEETCQYPSGFATSYLPTSSEKQAEMDAKLAALDKEYEQVLEEFGFVFEEPELTPEQERKLEERLEEAMMANSEHWVQFDIEVSPLIPYTEPSEEDLKKMDDMMAKMEEELNKILREFGFVIEEPILSEQEQQKMDEKLDEIDKKYDQVFSEYGFGDFFAYPVIMDLSPEKQAEFEEKLSELDSQYEKLYEEFGLSETFITIGP